MSRATLRWMGAREVTASVLCLALALCLFASRASGQTITSVDVLAKPMPDKDRAGFVLLIWGKDFGSSTASVSVSVEPSEGVLIPPSVTLVSQGTLILARFEAIRDYAARRLKVKVGEKESNTFELPNPEPEESKDVHVFRSIIDPKNVSDIFGKRIAKRFVAIQVTVTNRSKDFNFLIHDISLIFKQGLTPEEQKVLREAIDKMLGLQATGETQPKEEAEKLARKLLPLLYGRPSSEEHAKEYELSSIELSILRGVAEKGQVCSAPR